MTCGIYSLTNVATGKRYVGQSINIEARWRQHQKGRDLSAIGAAIAKHGWSAFLAEVLQECQRDGLNEAEVGWIARLGTLSPAGYNLRTGGGQNAAFSDDVRARISQATKASLTPEVLARRRESMKGIPKSPEWRAAMSERMKARYSDPAQVEILRQRAANASPETRAKISAAKAGKKACVETRARMSAIAKADGRAERMRCHANYMSIEARQKMASSAKVAPRHRDAVNGRWKAP